MKGMTRRIAALLAGCAGAVAIAAVAFGVLRALWPEYGAAEPTIRVSRWPDPDRGFRRASLPVEPARVGQARGVTARGAHGRK